MFDGGIIRASQSVWTYTLVNAKIFHRGKVMFFCENI